MQQAQKEKEDDESCPEEFVGLCDFTASDSDQLSFSAGDRILVHAKTSPEWWWGELHGVFGYVPTSYLLHQGLEEDDSSLEDPWQDEEYFSSYGTLFEFMVESVLVARDRWLREGGVMWPSSASLTLVPCQAHSYYTEKMAFWERPYGLDFTALKPLAQQEFFTKPKFSHLTQPDDCLATPCDVISLDMHTLQVTDLEEMKGQFEFPVKKLGTFHGFTAWFAVHFQSLETGAATVELNTGPNSE